MLKTTMINLRRLKNDVFTTKKCRDQQQGYSGVSYSLGPKSNNLNQTTMDDGS
jgi:hypothetical protein